MNQKEVKNGYIKRLCTTNINSNNSKYLIMKGVICMLPLAIQLGSIVLGRIVAKQITKLF